jgi:hypothetical protein
MKVKISPVITQARKYAKYAPISIVSLNVLKKYFLD